MELLWIGGAAFCRDFRSTLSNRDFRLKLSTSVTYLISLKHYLNHFPHRSATITSHFTPRIPISSNFVRAKMPAKDKPVRKDRKNTIFSRSSGCVDRRPSRNPTKYTTFAERQARREAKAGEAKANESRAGE